jgi:hypothetical protein
MVALSWFIASNENMRGKVTADVVRSPVQRNNNPSMDNFHRLGNTDRSCKQLIHAEST